MIPEQVDTRLFTRFMKEECWKRVRNILQYLYNNRQARPVIGRDPERWRLDAVGNTVSYRLRGCEGCMCHEYDHIIPFSKGGRTEVENCQILQTRVNRYKGNEMNDEKKLVGYSCARSYTGTTNNNSQPLSINLIGYQKRSWI